MSEEEVESKVIFLSRLQSDVLLKAATEAPFTGETVNGYDWDCKDVGVYQSAVSGAPLFSSKAKYESGTGWPSFYEPVDSKNIIERIDPMDRLELPDAKEYWRTEVLDRASMTHLGHVFNDGPPPTGKRYCINAAALTFAADPTAPKPRRSRAEAALDDLDMPVTDPLSESIWSLFSNDFLSWSLPNGKKATATTAKAG